MAAGVRRGGFRRGRRAAARRRRRGNARHVARRARRIAAHHARAPVRSAIRSTREWGVLPGGVAVVEMAQASGLALVSGHNDPLRGEHARHRRADRGGARPGIQARRRRGRRERDDRRRARRGRSARLVAAGHEGHGRVRRRDAVRRRRERVTGRRRARAPAQIALLDPPARRCSPTSTARAPASTSPRSTGAGAAGGLAGGLAAIGAELEPGFDVVAEAVGLEAALEGADLAITGEGKLDASSLEGKVVGGVLGVGRRPRRRAASRSSRVRPPTTCAPRSPSDPACEVLALTDRVWQSSETYSRAALLVEEAAIEAARNALGTPAP